MPVMVLHLPATSLNISAVKGTLNPELKAGADPVSSSMYLPTSSARDEKMSAAFRKMSRRLEGFVLAQAGNADCAAEMADLTSWREADEDFHISL
jgi:hypothetical protein